MLMEIRNFAVVIAAQSPDPEALGGADGDQMETKLVLESLRQAERMRINFDERSEFISKEYGVMLLGC